MLTFLSYAGTALSIIGLLLIVLCFILIQDEGPYKTSKRVLFGDSLNNLIAGFIIGIIGFAMLCVEGQMTLH